MSFQLQINSNIILWYFVLVIQPVCRNAGLVGSVILVCGCFTECKFEMPLDKYGTFIVQLWMGKRYWNFIKLPEFFISTCLNTYVFLIKHFG